MTKEPTDERSGLPERVGPYRLESRLGVGGMGAVYRAYDQRLERPVAIKHILPEAASDEKARERLRREARAVASLNHPAIVQIFDIVEMEEGDWIVMELVEGQTLHRLASRGRLELGQAVYLGREIAEGLAEAHSKGIVHRDLKTENVMVTLSGHAKILDFGLAKQMWKGKAEGSISVQGSILGTGRAMSPEQAMGEMISHRSDLFSLGSLLYETTTGQPPFLGSSIFHTLAQVCSDRQKPARELNPRVPPELSKLIDELLEKNPKNRPASAGEVADRLATLGRQLSSEQSNSFPPRINLPPAASTAETDPMPASIEKTATGTQAVSPVGVHPDLSSGPRFGARVDSPRHGGGSSGIFIRTLVMVSLVDETPDEEPEPPSRIHELSGRHDRLVRDLLPFHNGLEIDKREGFVLLFERPADAARFALAYQLRVLELGEGIGRRLLGRCGIHLGEIFLRENSRHDITHGAKPLEVEGVNKNIVQQVAALARGGQILLTKGAFELAERSLHGQQVEGRELRWEVFGAFELEGVEESLQIGEVGFPGVSGFHRPTPPLAASEATRGSSIWSGSGLGMVAGVVLVLLLTAGLLGRRSVQEMPPEVVEPTPPPAVAEVPSRLSVAILGFKNLSQQTETDWLSTALSEMLSTELAAGDDLRLVPGESVSRMKRELEVPEVDALAPETLAVVGRNLGIEYVIAGSYLALGQEGERDLRLNLLVQRTDGADDAIRFSQAGGESDIFDLVVDTAVSLRSRLDLGDLTSAQAEAAEATLSTSPEAMRLYAQGLEKMRDFEVAEARDLLGRAVASDSGFALAHAALSEAWLALGYDSEAAKSAQKAFELSAGLPRQHSLLIEGRFHETAAAWDEAIGTYEALFRFYPDSIDYGLRLARAQGTSGSSADALQTIDTLRRLGREDPRIELLEAEVTYGAFDYERSLAAAREAEEQGKRHSAKILVAEALRVQGRALMQLDRRDEAIRVLLAAEELFEEAGDQGRKADAMATRATVLQFQGKIAEAETLHLESMAVADAIGNREAKANGQNTLALLYQRQGKLAEARALLEQAVRTAREIGDRNQEAWYLDSMVWVVYHQGELDDARRLALEELAIYEDLESGEGLAWSHFYLGQIALRAGDVAGAREAYEKGFAAAGEEGSDYQLGFLHYGLGEALLEAGDLEGAARESEIALDLRSRLDEPGTLAASRLMMARLALEAGRAAEAESLARRSAAEFSQAKMPDFVASADAMTARAQLRAGRIEEAEATLRPALPTAARSEVPATRIAVGLAQAEWKAARRELANARYDLDQLIGECRSAGWRQWSLQLQLAREELLRDGGAPSPPAISKALAESAAASGFRRIEARALALVTAEG